MKKMKIAKLLVLAAVLAVSPACKKNKAEPKQEPAGSAMGNAGSAPAPDPAPVAKAPEPAAAAAEPAADTGDWIKVHASHTAKKETDPVVVKFEKFKVVKADFDPQKIEGGTATIELDMASINTGDTKRDEHVGSPDYLDVKKFTTATINVSNVKKKDDKSYTADAAVKFHGADKTYPIVFEVVEAKDNWIRIKAEHSFKRLDFGVGKQPDPDPKKGDGVADDLQLQAQLTLRKT